MTHHGKKRRPQNGPSWGPALTELLVGLVCLGIAGLALLWVSGVLPPPKELPSVRRPWHFTAFSTLEQWLWLAFWTVMSFMVLFDGIRRALATAGKRRDRSLEDQGSDDRSASGRQPMAADRPLLGSKRKRRR